MLERGLLPNTLLLDHNSLQKVDLYRGRRGEEKAEEVWNIIHEVRLSQKCSNCVTQTSMFLTFARPPSTRQTLSSTASLAAITMSLTF